MMVAAWTCLEEPQRHGSFPQSGLDTLSALYGALQPRDRYGCPVCFAAGKEGWVRPASSDEVDKVQCQV